MHAITLSHTVGLTELPAGHKTDHTHVPPGKDMCEL